MQHAHDGDTIRAWDIENQIVLEIFDAPLAHSGKIRMAQRQRRADHRLTGQIVETRLGAGQESFRRVQPRLFCERHRLLDQIMPGRRVLVDRRHQRGFFWAATFLKASARSSFQSAAVSAAFELLNPSSNFASSSSSALRFSSARMSTRTYSLALLYRP